MNFLILTRYSEGSRLSFKLRLFMKCRVPLKTKNISAFRGLYNLKINFEDMAASTSRPIMVFYAKRKVCR